jgi:hypothetical protein
MRIEMDRKQTIVISAVICAALVFTVSAKGQTISGSGTRNCSAFGFALEQDSNIAIDSFLAWAQGFISGYNAGNRRGVDFAIDHASLVHWLAGYCAANPETPFYQAVQNIIGIQSP